MGRRLNICEMEGIWRQVQRMDHKRRRHCKIFSFSKQTLWIIFFIRLPSNSSINIYPENRTCSYVTKLPDEIHLTGRWEIGLKEIQYPLSWFNIEEWVGNFTVEATNVADIENDHKVVYGLKLPVSYYSSPIKMSKKQKRVSSACR